MMLQRYEFADSVSGCSPGQHPSACAGERFGDRRSRVDRLEGVPRDAEVGERVVLLACGGVAALEENARL